METRPLKLLLIEDSEQDAALILRQFSKSSLSVDTHRVWDEKSLSHALADSWDLVLCDFNLPGFDAFRALEMVKATRTDTPFMIVSGMIGEETAVEAMRAGAHDYILKSNLPRLVPAVQRELKEAKMRASYRQTQAALAASEAKFRRLVDSTSLGVIVSGVSGELLEVNDAFLRLIGYTQEDLANGLRWDRITPSKYAKIEQERVEEAIQRGSCTPYEKEYIRRDGTRVPVLIGYALLEKSPPTFICYIADLTERKKIESELKKALRSRDEFLSIASHELKTPLTSLSLQIQLVERYLQPSRLSSLTGEQLARPMNVANRQIHRLNTLINDLLDVSRIANGKLSVRLDTFDASHLLADVVSRLEEHATLAGCELTIQSDPEIRVRWDQHRIDQVIANLLSNAFKYAPRAPVAVRLEKKGNQAVLSVKDHGPGIPFKDQQKVFDRFERASCHTNHVQGLGLGLFIVKEIVQLHQGEIELRSAPNEGCEFRVTIPLEPAVHESKTESLEPQPIS